MIGFGQLGAESFLSAMRHEQALTTADIVRQVAPDTIVHSYGCDLRHPAEIAELADSVSRESGCLDLQICNGSFWLPGRLAENDDQAVVDSIRSTMVGTALMTKRLLPLLTACPAADVAKIVARCALPSDQHLTSSEAFSAAKTGQYVFGARVRDELRGTGIRVIQLYPPNFQNTSLLNPESWNERRSEAEDRLPSARNVFDALLFAPSQDRRCSVDEIGLSNTRTDVLQDGLVL